jgi:hypothetical protein
MGFWSVVMQMSKQMIVAGFLGLFAVAGSSSTSFAQCSVRNSMRSVALAWQSGFGDVSLDTGWIPGPVTRTAYAWDDNPSRGCIGAMTQNGTADFGRLAFDASGNASTQSAGMFLYSSGELGFSDTLSIQSDSLPVGTPVTLRYSVMLTGSVGIQDANPQSNIYTTLGPCATQNVSLPGSASQTCQNSVGATFVYWQLMNWSLNAPSISGIGPISSSIAANAEAIYRIEVLTPGVRIVSCSGRDYTAPVCDSIDFNRNGVFPEDQDVIDFFNVLAGGACAQCSDIDFNNNGVFPEDQDAIDFFTVLAGGQCGA